MIEEIKCLARETGIKLSAGSKVQPSRFSIGPGFYSFSARFKIERVWNTGLERDIS